VSLLLLTYLLFASWSPCCCGNPCCCKHPYYCSRFFFFCVPADACVPTLLIEDIFAVGPANIKIRCTVASLLSLHFQPSLLVLVLLVSLPLRSTLLLLCPSCSKSVPAGPDVPAFAGAQAAGAQAAGTQAVKGVPALYGVHAVAGSLTVVSMHR
jgi:hypothetical protein